MAALGFGRVWAWFGVRGSIKAGWCRVQYTSMQQAICMVHYGLWREREKYLRLTSNVSSVIVATHHSYTNQINTPSLFFFC